MQVTLDDRLDKTIDDFCKAHNISRDEAVERCIRMALMPHTIEPWGFRKVKPEEKK